MPVACLRLRRYPAVLYSILADLVVDHAADRGAAQRAFPAVTGGCAGCTADCRADARREHALNVNMALASSIAIRFIAAPPSPDARASADAIGPADGVPPAHNAPRLCNDGSLLPAFEMAMKLALLPDPHLSVHPFDRGDAGIVDQNGDLAPNLGNRVANALGGISGRRVRTSRRAASARRPAASRASLARIPSATDTRGSMTVNAEPVPGPAL